MTDPLTDWHTACSRWTAELERARSQQFGLHPAVGTNGGAALHGMEMLPGEVWAWQRFAQPAERRDVPEERVVRVGFAGQRVHLGHLGLARTSAEIAGPRGTVLIFDASLSAGAMVEDFRAVLRRYAKGPVSTKVVEDDAGLRRVQHEALSALRLDKLRRLYGWDDKTRASALTDLAAMLGFFLYTPEGLDGPGFALVDAQQAPHSALLRQAARAAGTAAPTLLYRRLFPSLRRHGERGSVRDPASVVFVDDDDMTVRRKFVQAVTGGRASATEQRARGGDPTRCAAFSMIELLCTKKTAEKALTRCQSGQVLCARCKSEHVDSVSAGLRQAVGSAARAGQSSAVRDSVSRAAADLHRLPPREATGLEATIASQSDVPPGHVVVGRGSTEVMDWLFREQSAPGAEVVATEPTFELYRDLAERHQLRYVSVPWDQAEFSHDMRALSRAVSEHTVLCVLDIPHSVSGVGTSTGLIDRLAKTLPPGAVLLLDMVAADYVRSPPGSAAQLLERYPNAVICGSLSKVHSLLGIRVGYALAAAPLAERLRRHRLPYAVDTLSLAAAEAALNDDGARLRTVSASHEARDRLTGVLRQLGVRYAPTESNVLLMDLGTRFESVANQLAATGRRFRDGRRWDMPGWMQVHLIDAGSTEAVTSVLLTTTRDDNEQA